jgi:hypothetical protein
MNISTLRPRIGGSTPLRFGAIPNIPKDPHLEQLQQTHQGFVIEEQRLSTLLTANWAEQKKMETQIAAAIQKKAQIELALQSAHANHVGALNNSLVTTEAQLAKDEPALNQLKINETSLQKDLTQAQADLASSQVTVNTYSGITPLNTVPTANKQPGKGSPQQQAQNVLSPISKKASSVLGAAAKWGAALVLAAGLGFAGIWVAKKSAAQATSPVQEAITSLTDVAQNDLLKNADPSQFMNGLQLWVNEFTAACKNPEVIAALKSSSATTQEACENLQAFISGVNQPESIDLLFPVQRRVSIADALQKGHFAAALLTMEDAYNQNEGLVRNAGAANDISLAASFASELVRTSKNTAQPFPLNLLP